MELAWCHAGSKGDLADLLIGVYVAAAKQGVTPEQYRNNQLSKEQADKDKPRTAEPDYALPLEEWTLLQLRQEVRERGQLPKGKSWTLHLISERAFYMQACQGEATLV